MKPPRLKIVILGLSITSSWGNGHATTYRGLAKGLRARCHEVLFLEREQAWYAENRDLPCPSFCETELYHSLEELQERFEIQVRDADLVLVGSYVPEGAAVGDWVLHTTRGMAAFYDIDTPVTLSGLQAGRLDYLTTELIPRYHLYLSFTGGPILQKLESDFGSPKARPLYCSVDPTLYFPENLPPRWDLGYLGTFSPDRQPNLDELLIQPAQTWRAARFVVAGPQYPDAMRWPSNVHRIMHLSPAEHRQFYNEQRFALNITRRDMIHAGYSPSIRLFEAAACGTPIISDYWEGLDSFFEIGDELLIARNRTDTLRFLRELPEEDRRQIGMRARDRVLREHTAAHRAAELESYILEERQQLASAGNV